MRLLPFLLALSIGAGAQSLPRQQLTAAQDTLVARYVTRGAERFSYLAPQWQEWLDAGLAQDSTIAALWQMKAMPLFKTRKYELGMENLDKAVRYDSAAWLPYRAFIKTIFSKQYRSALADLEICRSRLGNDYVMDHPFDIYRALCHLQLNEWAKALPLLEGQAKDDAAHGRSHHLRLFYLGVARYESGLPSALEAFNQCISQYRNFSDAYFYKGKCLIELGRREEGLAAMRTGKALYQKGYTINEDNSFYEPYPYQVSWQWRAVK